MCRTLDALERLDALVRAEGPFVTTRAGVRPHHAQVEARAQRLVLLRLVASLRLPAGWDDDAAPVTPMRRPQRRGAARGSYAAQLGGAS